MRSTLLLAPMLYATSAAALSTGYTPPTYRSPARTTTAGSALYAGATTSSNDESSATNDDQPDTASSMMQNPTRRTALQKLLAFSTTSSALSLMSPATSLASQGTTNAATAATVPATLATPPQLRATTWPLGKVAFSLLPLAGTYTRRATVMETLVEDGKRGNIWTFDQVQGVVNVNVPVRMTVIKVCFS